MWGPGVRQRFGRHTPREERFECAWLAVSCPNQGLRLKTRGARRHPQWFLDFERTIRQPRVARRQGPLGQGSARNAPCSPPVERMRLHDAVASLCSRTWRRSVTYTGGMHLYNGTGDARAFHLTVSSGPQYYCSTRTGGNCDLAQLLRAPRRARPPRAAVPFFRKRAASSCASPLRVRRPHGPAPLPVPIR